MKCPKCGSDMTKCGRCSDTGKQIYKCKNKACGKKTVNPINDNSQPMEKTNGKKRGISVSEIVRTHDVEELIKQGKKKLQKGTLFSEQEFVELAGIKNKHYRTMLDSPDMAKYRGKIDGIIYYGVPADIEYLKNERYIMR